jgi:hypothetical protein
MHLSETEHIHKPDNNIARLRQRERQECIIERVRERQVRHHTGARQHREQQEVRNTTSIEIVPDADAKENKRIGSVATNILVILSEIDHASHNTRTSKPANSTNH